MTLRKRNKRADPVTIAEPTPEQQARASYDREIQTGMAAAPYRRVPSIVQMALVGRLPVSQRRDQPWISQRQYDGLARYREVSGLSDNSDLRSCLDFSPRGSGEGLAPFGVRNNGQLEYLDERLADYLEGELHDLREITKFVAGKDHTIDEWVASRLGTIGLTQAEERNVKAGARKIATVEIRMAGEWLAAAIGA